MKRRSKKKWGISIVVGLFATFSLYPLIYLLFYSLKSSNEIFYTNPFGLPMDPMWENYGKAIQQFDIITYYKNSIIVTLVSLGGVLILDIPFAYAITRMKWKWKNMFRTYMMLGLFIPVQVSIIPLSVFIKQLHLANTYGAVILPYIAFNLAFPCMILSVSYSSIPRELEEAAFIDGATVIDCFFKIGIPLVKPAISTAMLFAALGIWNEYTLATVLISKNGYKTLPLGLASFVGQRSTDWGAMGACMVLASIPTIFLYLFFSQKVENSLTIGGAVKG